jgi:hypothetical protein
LFVCLDALASDWQDIEAVQQFVGWLAAFHAERGQQLKMFMKRDVVFP